MGRETGSDQVRSRFPGYFVQSGHHVKLIDDLRRLRCPVNQEEFERTVFCIVKPDGVASGLLLDISDWWSGKGFQIDHVLPIWRPQERNFEELYKFNLTLRNSQNQLGSWWMNRKVYTMGPSIGLLLSREGQAGAELYEAVAELKGASDPFVGRPGELRFDLGAPNATMNLFHCADDPISSVREYLIFAGVSGLRNLSMTLGKHRDSNESRNKLSAIQGALPRVHDLDTSHVLTRIVLNAFLIAGVEAEAAGTMRALLAERLPDAASRMQRLLGLRSELARTADANHARLESVGSGFYEALKTTLLFPNVKDDEVDKALETLAGYGVVMSEWDRMNLVSTAHYHWHSSAQLPTAASDQVAAQE